MNKKQLMATVEKFVEQFSESNFEVTCGTSEFIEENGVANNDLYRLGLGIVNMYLSDERYETDEYNTESENSVSEVMKRVTDNEETAEEYRIARKVIEREVEQTFMDKILGFSKDLDDIAFDNDEIVAELVNSEEDEVLDDFLLKIYRDKH